MLDVSRLGRKSYVSQSALSEILTAVKQADELPEGTSRHSVKRKRQSSARVSTPYGDICKTWDLLKTDGSTVKVHFQDPAPMLWHLVNECPNLASFLEERMDLHPCSAARPWGLVFYSDEVTPGNALKANNRRRMQAVYWSLAELGSDAIVHERAWMLLTCVRTKTVQQLQDGMSQLCRRCLLAFMPPRSPFATGMQLRMGGGRTRILLAAWRTIISDESALKHMLNNKGASGKLPCALCRNVIRKLYAPEPLHPPLLLRTSLEEARFLQHTTASLVELSDYLEEQSTVLNKGQMQELQTRLGYHHSPQGVLACRDITTSFDVAGAICFDWMHIYLVSGLFHHELNLMLVELAKVQVKGDIIHGLMQELTWPSHIGSKGASARHMFETKKKPEDDVKSSASEALSAYPAIRMFVNDILRDMPGLPANVTGAIRCFILMCSVLDVLMLASQDNGVRHVNGLRSAIHAHLAAFKAVYGEDAMIPKAHYALHLPRQLEKFQCLLSCFVQERRHKELKRFANNQTNSSEGTEKHLMEEMLLSHLEELRGKQMVVRPGLVNPKPAHRDVQLHFQGICSLSSSTGLVASKKAYFAPNRWASTGDVVLIRNPAGIGEVIYHCQYQELTLTCICPYPKHAAKSNCFRVKRDEHAFILTSNIEKTCVFKEFNGLCIVAP